MAVPRLKKFLTSPGLRTNVSRRKLHFRKSSYRRRCRRLAQGKGQPTKIA